MATQYVDMSGILKGPNLSRFQNNKMIFLWIGEFLQIPKFRNRFSIGADDLAACITHVKANIVSA